MRKIYISGCFMTKKIQTECKRIYFKNSNTTCEIGQNWFIFPKKKLSQATDWTFIEWYEQVKSNAHLIIFEQKSKNTWLLNCFASYVSFLFVRKFMFSLYISSLNTDFIQIIIIMVVGIQQNLRRNRWLASKPHWITIIIIRITVWEQRLPIGMVNFRVSSQIVTWTQVAQIVVFILSKRTILSYQSEINISAHLCSV